MKKQIVIIDYGIGNVISVKNAISCLGYDVRISREEHRLKTADLLILPGVGAFEEGMNNLVVLKMKDLLDEIVLIQKKPILGICLGMQLMADSSEENGLHKGLGWISGDVKLLKLQEEFTVPHVGWNNLVIKQVLPLFNRLPVDPNFYFDHSYHYCCEDSKHMIASTDYASEIAAVINKENIWGVQFHPEKSQNNGLKLFRGLINEV